MPISPYIRQLRAHVGPMRLLLSSVTAAVRDERGDLLLVRQRDGNVWSTPGGAIEPDERPADAVVRETWEETGLIVTPRRLIAVWGGPEFVVRYANGDETQYVMSVFECVIDGGTRRADGEETVETRFWSMIDAAALPLAAWLRAVLPRLYADQPPSFDAPGWRPPDRPPTA